MKVELQKRVTLLAKAKDNLALQQVEIELCRRDPLYRFSNYVYTDKNTSLYSSDEPNVLPFIPYEFQEEAVIEIRNSIIDGTKSAQDRKELTNVFIEKSRQMGLSWLIMGIFVYGFIFHDHKYHVISQKEEYVDKIGDMKSLFEKARFMLRNLPSWMLPEGYTKATGSECNKYMVLSRSDSTGAITGESANPNASRSGTYNAILLDEFAFQSNAAAINSAAASATPCRIFNSTPNGEGNEFFRMRKLSIAGVDKRGNNIIPTVKGLRYHRSDHPLYTQERYNEKIKGMAPEVIAAELEINYNSALVGRVYTDFATESTEVKYNPEKPLYVTIDNSHGGADPHALILAQLDGTYINIVDAIEFNCSVTEMANICITQPKHRLTDMQVEFLDRYKKYDWRRATFIADPYDTHSTLNQSTIFEEYRKVGIYLNTPQERKKKEQIMKTKSNTYRIRYNDYCLDFASAIMNARYPERPESSTSTRPADLPIHDRTSHYRSGLEYLVVYILENPMIKKQRVAEDTRVKRNYTTGELKYPQRNRTVRKDKLTGELISIGK